MAANPGSRPAPMWRPRSSPARQPGHPRTATSAWRRHPSKTRCKSGRRRATSAGQTRADRARSVDPGSRQRRERRAATVPPPPTPETTRILRARFRRTEPARMPATVSAPGWRNRVRADRSARGLLRNAWAPCSPQIATSSRVFPLGQIQAARGHRPMTKRRPESRKLKVTGTRPHHFLKATKRKRNGSASNHG